MLQGNASSEQARALTPRIDRVDRVFPGSGAWEGLLINLWYKGRNLENSERANDSERWTVRAFVFLNKFNKAPDDLPTGSHVGARIPVKARGFLGL